MQQNSVCFVYKSDLKVGFQLVILVLSSSMIPGVNAVIIHLRAHVDETTDSYLSGGSLH